MNDKLSDNAVDMTKNVYLTGNPELEAALKVFNEGLEKCEPNFDPVFDLIVQQMKEDVEVIVPVDFPNGAPIPDGEAADFNLLQLDGEGGDSWIAAFTSEGEYNKGPKTSSMPLLMKTLFEFAMEDQCDGVVLNPFGDNVNITKDGIEAMLKALEPPTQDEIDLDEGAEAYRQGNFEKAVEFYTKSAAEGNATALSNLGYCYYYGRSLSVDKVKAHECWEKAAILGDICATYKIGDMYRNGDLPKDEVFAKLMYKKAFGMALNTMDIYNYPDAFLRIIKFCSEEFDKEALLELAKKCRDGFQARIDAGDTFTDKLLKEAEELCAKYGPTEEESN